MTQIHIAIGMLTIVAACGGGSSNDGTSGSGETAQSKIVELIEASNSTTAEPHYTVDDALFSGAQSARDNCYATLGGCGAYRIGLSEAGELIGGAGYRVDDPSANVELNTVATYAVYYTIGHGWKASDGSFKSKGYEDFIYPVFNPATDTFSSGEGDTLELSATVNGRGLSGTFTHEETEMTGIIEGYVDDKNLLGALSGSKPKNVLSGYMMGSRMGD